MSPEAQRIAIAEACGWRIETRPSHTILLNPEGHTLWHYDGRGNSYGPCRSWEDCLRKGSHYAQRVPDYLNDLNACHEIEKTLTETQGGDYDSNLWLIIQRDKTRPASWHATAAKRAEAFLRVLNLWKD